MVSDKVQIFLLHFAGGSCYSFDFLTKNIQSDFEVHSLELPGRGKRSSEELLRSKNQCVIDYVAQIKQLRNDNPFIIYGHSMGATLSLSVAKILEYQNDPPEYLVVSGNAGPGLNTEEGNDPSKKRYLMSDSDFKQELVDLGGVPMEILENEELFNFFSPIMRADFEVLEKDNFSERDLKINVPVFALMGSEEEDVVHIENWKNFTQQDFQYRILQGNHFFINHHAKLLAAILSEYASKFGFVKV